MVRISHSHFYAFCLASTLFYINAEVKTLFSPHCIIVSPPWWSWSIQDRFMESVLNNEPLRNNRLHLDGFLEIDWSAKTGWVAKIWEYFNTDYGHVNTSCCLTITAVIKFDHFMFKMIRVYIYIYFLLFSHFCLACGTCSTLTGHVLTCMKGTHEMFDSTAGWHSCLSTMVESIARSEEIKLSRTCRLSQNDSLVQSLHITQNDFLKAIWTRMTTSRLSASTNQFYCNFLHTSQKCNHFNSSIL